jgi:hypothetical protein
MTTVGFDIATFFLKTKFIVFNLILIDQLDILDLDSVPIVSNGVTKAGA